MTPDPDQPFRQHLLRLRLPWAIGQTSGNDFGPVTNMATGNVLTDPAASTVDGTRLVVKNGNGDLSAPWRFSYHHYVDG